MKNVLPDLIGPGMIAWINDRFLGESGRLIADITEICDLEQLEGELVASDFENVFDSLNHNFTITDLEHYSFGNDFIEWIKTVLKNQESLMINRSQTAKFFRLKGGARQRDPISAYLFILALEIIFIFVKLS